MKTSKRFNEFRITQKIGLLFMVLGALVILAKILQILTDNEFLKEGLSNYWYAIGALLMLPPVVGIRLRNHKANTFSVFVLLMISSSFTIAQDYSKQVDAFKQSLSEKSVEPLKEYISPQLKFDPIPAANTPAILTNIASNLPTLNSITILESSEGKAMIKYDFDQLGVRESFMHFDIDGKFIRIELIEKLIQQEIKAQQRLQQSVQQPSETDLVKKYPPKPVEFKAEDGLIVNGNLYEVDAYKPVILLSHQAGYNRIEYLDIAPRLNEMGFNCLAIDLRSGGNFADKLNETAERAKKEGVKNEMIDAQQDIKAAIDFLNSKFKSKVIIWGSSYSASLSILEGVSNDRVKAIIAFSPGDYFGNNAPSLETVFAKTKKPFLVTSSKEEAAGLTALIGNTKLSENQSQFIPMSDGYHGSRALWIGQEGIEEYWNSVVTFLNTISKI